MDVRLLAVCPQCLSTGLAARSVGGPPNSTFLKDRMFGCLSFAPVVRHSADAYPCSAHAGITGASS